MKPKYGTNLLIATVLLAIIGGCSTRRNTAGTRFYHSLTTRYNVYFNAKEAYQQGLLELEQQNKDNYLERISLFPTGAFQPATRSQTSRFSRSIEKSQKAIRQHSIKRKPIRRPGRQYTDEYRQWLNRREFNPYLYNAWLLLGKAHYHNADTTDAVATFTYIRRLYDRQPDITAEAGIWLARCYTMQGWYYEAADMLRRIQNDSLPNSLTYLYSSVTANLLLEQDKLKESVPHLLATVKEEDNKLQRARQYYLLGQVYQELNEKDKAYEAFSKVIRHNPPYELELAARIRQTEVIPGEETGKVINRLNRMTRDEKNKDYLDQLYYALGNAYLIQQDTTRAISEFTLGVEKSIRNGAEKGVLLLRMGHLFWIKERYEESQKAYSQAIGLLNATHPEREKVNNRLEVLDELVTHTRTIRHQDSLQYLASLSESERIKAIEKLIEETARKEKEARANEETIRQQQEDRAGDTVFPISTPNADNWYFYNPMMVAQGKTEFERIWGRRKLEDNWRRRNKTVVNLDSLKVADTIPSDEDAKNSPGDNIASDSAATDTKNVDYYLKQIPLTVDAMEQSNKLLSDGLYNLALVYKDKLPDYNRATETFARLIRQFPDYPQSDNVYYHLYLLSLRRADSLQAESYKNTLLSTHPESKYSVLLSDPDFSYNAIHGKHLEDSLYADTYLAWKQQNYKKVIDNNHVSAVKYPLGRNRSKFKFFHAMSALQLGDTKIFLSELKEIVQDYPQAEITELAAYILKGIQEGRTPNIGTTPFGNIWQRRSIDLQLETSVEADTITKTFSTEKNTPHLFILAYESGTVDENTLLFEVARYNFSTFVVKNFDLNFAKHHGISMLQVRPFTNLDEARQYGHQLYADKTMATTLGGLRAIIISEENYNLLLKQYSFEDYDQFYQEQFASGLIEEINLDCVDFEEVKQ